MVGRLVPVQIGGVEVQIETVREPGSEPTTRISDAAERVRSAFDSAHEVILWSSGSVSPRAAT